jgi:hypothetical protein
MFPVSSVHLTYLWGSLLNIVQNFGIKFKHQVDSLNRVPLQKLTVPWHKCIASLQAFQQNLYPTKAGFHIFKY